jgi:hypothetical protein
MDVGRALTFLFEDLHWPRKLGLGVLLRLVPILNFSVTGYEVRTARRVAADEMTPLPEWDDLGGLWMEGLWLSMARVTYAVVAVLLVALPLSGAGLSVFWAFSDRSTNLPIGAILLLSSAAVLLALLLGAGLSLLWPGVVALYVHDPRYRTCFRLGAVLGLLARFPSAYLTLWGIPILLAVGVAAVLLPLLGLFNLIPCLGGLVSLGLGVASTVALLLLSAHLEGQFVFQTGLLTPARDSAPAAERP